MAKPEWWNDEGLKVPVGEGREGGGGDDADAHQMRAFFLSGLTATWEVGPARSRSSWRRPRTTSGLRRCMQCCRLRSTVRFLAYLYGLLPATEYCTFYRLRSTVRFIAYLYGLDSRYGT